MRLSAQATPAATAGGSSALRLVAAPAAAQRRRPERGRRQEPLLVAAASTQAQQLAADQQLIQELEAALPGAAEDSMPAAATAEPRPAVSGGALSLVASGGQEQEVPTTLSGALATFFTHPSAMLIVCALAGLVCWRAQLPLQHPAADAAVAGAVAAGWCVQVSRSGLRGVVQAIGWVVCGSAGCQLGWTSASCPRPSMHALLRESCCSLRPSKSESAKQASHTLQEWAIRAWRLPMLTIRSSRSQLTKQSVYGVDPRRSG